MSKNSNKVKNDSKEMSDELSRNVKFLGEKAIKFFKENFEKQGFDDAVVTKWSSKINDDDPNRPILIKSGDLEKSLKITSTSKDTVTIGTDVKYASFINNGTPNMSARPFMGKSENLDKIIKEEIDRIITNKFKH